MKFASQSLLATALAAASFCAQATTPSLELFTSPNNWIFNGLSSNGSTDVFFANSVIGSATSTGTWMLTPSRSYQYLGSNVSGNVGVSADGNYINGIVSSPSGPLQAAVYSVSSGTWTTLGGLNGGSSSSYGISADGSTVVGNGTYINGNTSTTHAAVFKNGTVTDLTPTATQASNAVATSANGSVVVGSVNGNIVNGTIWKLNSSTGSYVPTTVTGTAYGTNAPVSSVIVDHVSANGAWAAGATTNTMGESFGTFFTGIRSFGPASITNTATGIATPIPYDHVLDTSAGSTDIDLNMKATVAGVSDNGTVIGGFNVNVGGTTGLLNTDTFIYFASTGQSETFDSYLSSLGLGLSPTQHVWALSSMSADGSAISGYYFDSSTNQTTGFILHEGVLSAVPEPSQWMLLGLGLPLLVARRLRRKE